MKIVSIVYDKFKYFGIFLKELVLKSIDDDIPGLSAQLAFFLVLSFFPFLTLIFSLISLSPFLTEDMLFDVLKALPDESVSLVWDIITGVARSKGIIITSALVAIWSVSAAIGTVAKAINRFYHIKEKRNIFVVRLKGMFYVTVTVFLIIAGFSAVVFGSLIGQGIAWLFPWFTQWWNVIRFVLLLMCALSIFIVIFKKCSSSFTFVSTARISLPFSASFTAKSYQSSSKSSPSQSKYSFARYKYSFNTSMLEIIRVIISAI